MRSVLLISVLFLAQSTYAQCAMCKAVAEDAMEESAANINIGILYIMMIPYIILLIAFRKKIINGFRQIRDIPKTTGQKKSG